MIKTTLAIAVILALSVSCGAEQFLYGGSTFPIEPYVAPFGYTGFHVFYEGNKTPSYVNLILDDKAIQLAKIVPTCEGRKQVNCTYSTILYNLGFGNHSYYFETSVGGEKEKTATKTLNLMPDRVQPAITIESPDEYDLLTGTVTLKGELLDPAHNIADFQLRVGDIRPSDKGGWKSIPWKFQELLDTTQFEDGYIDLELMAVDPVLQALGRASMSTRITLYTYNGPQQSFDRGTPRLVPVQAGVTDQAIRSRNMLLPFETIDAAAGETFSIPVLLGTSAGEARIITKLSASAYNFGASRTYDGVDAWESAYPYIKVREKPIVLVLSDGQVERGVRMDMTVSNEAPSGLYFLHICDEGYSASEQNLPEYNNILEFNGSFRGIANGSYTADEAYAGAKAFFPIDTSRRACTQFMKLNITAKPSAPIIPVAPAANCSDGIRNQGEEDADCGGVCAPCLPAEPQEPADTMPEIPDEGPSTETGTTSQKQDYTLLLLAAGALIVVLLIVIVVKLRR